MASAHSVDHERPLLLRGEKSDNPNLTSSANNFLRISLLLNVVSFLAILLGLASVALVNKSPRLESYGTNDESQWWLEAAADAQRASEVSCSGNGRVYVDSLEENVCECNDCFTGPDCSERIASCKADADSGDPLILEPFWESNLRAGAVVVAPTHRMSYSTEKGRRFTKQLEKLIRELHKLVGNAVTDNRFIVIGTGSMELVNAAVASLAPDSNTNKLPSGVVSRAPFYSVYKTQTEFFSSAKYSWEGDSMSAAAKFSNSNRSYIELITGPNNPDGSMLGPVLNNSHRVFDRAYYWPHFTPITRAVDDDGITLFTLSKLTGHAGSRLGWAIIKDREVYERMNTYVVLNTLGVSHDSQLRAGKLMKAVLAGYKKGADDRHKIFHFGHRVMDSRWKRLRSVFQELKMFSLNVIPPEKCLFFNKVISPAPAFAWVKCEDEAITDCNQFFLEAGIIGRPGPDFDSDSKHVRFAILKREDLFEHLIDRLLALRNSSLPSL